MLRVIQTSNSRSKPRRAYRSCSILVIDTGGAIFAQQMGVPYDRLLYLAQGGSHLAMNVTVKMLHEAPPLVNFDTLNRS